ncbi:MAG: ATP-binding protein [Planctomycetota bacterium]
MRLISTPEIAQMVAADLTQPKETTTQVIERVCSVIRTELSKGNSVSLPKLLTLEVERHPAEDNANETALSVNVKLANELRRDIEGGSFFNLLLCVPAKDFSTGAMIKRLTTKRRSVELAVGYQEIVRKLHGNSPNLVVLDANIPETFELVREIKTNSKTAAIGVILIHPEGESAGLVDGLRVMEDESVVEPFDLDDLVSRVDEELQRIQAESGIFVHSMRFMFQTEEQQIERANELMASLLEQVGMDPTAVTALGVAFREAVDNAARHGNKNNPGKKIDVIYIVDKAKVFISIEDEGPGFDTEIYLKRGQEGDAAGEARKRHKENRVGGLGIMLMLRCVDKLEYNYAGNQIKLTKFYAGEGAQAAAASTEGAGADAAGAGGGEDEPASLDMGAAPETLMDMPELESGETIEGEDVKLDDLDEPNQ